MVSAATGRSINALQQRVLLMSRTFFLPVFFLSFSCVLSIVYTVIHRQALSMKLHPDRNPDKGAALHFQAAKEAYEVLSCAEQKQQYDLGMAVVGGAGGGRGAAGASRGETILESELRTAVESGDVDSAVGKWVASGSSLKLLLFFIDALQRHKKLPTNLPELLTHLHATEASTGTGGSGAAQMPVSTEKVRLQSALHNAA